ncbi:MAG: hypothetical protein HOV83_03760 [Catenulispora sp.]|nr:hypothetical protein [Catenulispora sp.]
MRIFRGIVVAFVIYMIAMFAIPAGDPIIVIAAWGLALGLLFAIPPTRRLIIGRNRG